MRGRGKLLLRLLTLCVAALPRARSSGGLEVVRNSSGQIQAQVHLFFLFLLLSARSDAALAHQAAR